MSKMKGAGVFPEIQNRNGVSTSVLKGSTKLASRMACMRCNGTAYRQILPNGKSCFQCNICGTQYTGGKKF